MSCGRFQVFSGGSDLSVVGSAGGATEAVPALIVYMAEQKYVFRVLTAPATVARWGLEV